MDTIHLGSALEDIFDFVRPDFEVSAELRHSDPETTAYIDNLHDKLQAIMQYINRHYSTFDCMIPTADRNESIPKESF